MRKVHEGQRVSADEFETLSAALVATERGRDTEEQPETDVAEGDATARLRHARARAAAAGI